MNAKRDWEIKGSKRNAVSAFKKIMAAAVVFDLD